MPDIRLRPSPATTLRDPSPATNAPGDVNPRDPADLPEIDEAAPWEDEADRLYDQQRADDDEIVRAVGLFD